MPGAPSYSANRVANTEGESGQVLFIVICGTVHVTGNVEFEGGRAVTVGMGLHCDKNLTCVILAIVNGCSEDKG
jgi:hypothetical protein